MNSRSFVDWASIRDMISMQIFQWVHDENKSTSINSTSSKNRIEDSILGLALQTSQFQLGFLSEYLIWSS